MKYDDRRYVPGLLLWLSNKITTSAAQTYRERFNIGVTDWRVLTFIELHPWSTASQACAHMGIDKAAVSRSVAFLSESGFIESRPIGLRKIEYSTTAAGVKLHDNVLAVALAREEALLMGIKKSEREALIGILVRLLDNLDVVSRVGRGPEA